jgi:hypothetical protein
MSEFIPRQKSSEGEWPPHGLLRTLLREKANAAAVAVMMILLLFLQKQNLASVIYLFGLGTRLSGQGLKHMR